MFAFGFHKELKQWFAWILVLLYCFATGFEFFLLWFCSCSDMLLPTHMVCYLILLWLGNGLHLDGSVWFLPCSIWFALDWNCFGYIMVLHLVGYVWFYHVATDSLWFCFISLILVYLSNSQCTTSSLIKSVKAVRSPSVHIFIIMCEG